MSTALNNRMYMCFCCLVLFSFVIEEFKTLSMRKKEFNMFFICLFFLITFTVTGAIQYPSAEIGIREFAIYVSLLRILPVRYQYIEATPFWRILFWFFSTAIAITGVLMLLNNEKVWDFFSRYYVNYLYYIYTAYRVILKPVTFFAAHSISCFVYFLTYMTWELCESCKHTRISWIYRLIFAMLILAWRNNTSLFCIAAILMYYEMRYSKKLTMKRILIVMICGGAIVFAVASNGLTILEIVNSQGNRIFGRFTALGAGNLVYDINYLLEGGLLTGFVFVPNLFYTDCGMLVYTLRGGIILPILLYVLLYRSLKYYLDDDFNSRYIFICIIGFEIGYAALIVQRFLPLLLFFMLYNKMFIDK